MMPIGDENEPGAFPFLTYLFIAINLAVFFLVQVPNERFTYGWSTIPYEIIHGTDLTRSVEVTIDGRRERVPQAPGPTPIYLTLLSSMFMHGGIMHILGNMLYLWVFGDNVERRFGHGVFLAFYLISGLVADATQIALQPDSVIPTLGASGAIAGVLGGYLVLYPSNRVRVLILLGIFSRVAHVPALVAIGFWAVLQLINGIGSIALTEQTGGVAYGAHVGGFAAGLLMAILLRGTVRPRSESYGR